MKTIAEWEAKGWKRLAIAAGQTVAVAYDQEAQDLVLKGQVFGPGGGVLRGELRPQITTEENDSGCMVTASVAATVLYKLVDREEEEPEPELPADDTAKGKGKGGA